MEKCCKQRNNAEPKRHKAQNTRNSAAYRVITCQHIASVNTTEVLVFFNCHCYIIVKDHNQFYIACVLRFVSFTLPIKMHYINACAKTELTENVNKTHK